MNKNNHLQIPNEENLFYTECRIIDLDKEYHGCIASEWHCLGNVRWGIITNLSSDELEAKYSKTIKQITPFVILSKEEGAIITDYHNINASIRMQEYRHGHLFDITDEDLSKYPEQNITTIDYVDIIENKERIRRFRELLFCLPERKLSAVSKRRITKLIYQNKSYQQIAEEENVTKSAIHKSIMLGLQKIKKYF